MLVGAFPPQCCNIKRCSNVCVPFDSVSYASSGSHFYTARRTPASGKFSKTSQADIGIVDTGAAENMYRNSQNQPKVDDARACAQVLYTRVHLQHLKATHMFMQMARFTQAYLPLVCWSCQPSALSRETKSQSVLDRCRTGSCKGYTSLHQRTSCPSMRNISRLA